MVTETTQPEFPSHVLDLLEDRYLLKDENGKRVETPMQLLQRVANYVASVEERYKGNVEATSHAFLQAMLALDFLPNSPTLMNADTPSGQLAACFVLPIEDSVESIFETLKDAAQIQASGGGVGFAFSNIRPQGDAVRKTGGIASGPVPFLSIFDAATECIKQSGKRRGANMGILRVNHPDIEDFIKAKQNLNALNNFNISIGITEDFIKAVNENDDYDLVNPREPNAIWKTVKAKDIFDRIIEAAWNTGDPGMVFLDTINHFNPTPHIGDIQSTNPCGETPLLPYESCVLGSINLSNMVVDGQFDWEKLATIVQLSVRFLDNVIDVNKSPLPQIKESTLATRKIGLGIMGWADALIKLQIPYNSAQGVAAAEDVMEFISFHGKLASVQLARERGAFPEYERSLYNTNPNHLILEEKRTDSVLQNRPTINWQDVRRQLKKYGIRNATVTTIAPTGSISTIAGTSSGIEPLFALAYTRRMGDKEIIIKHDLFSKVVEELGFDDRSLLVQEVASKGNLEGIKGFPDHTRELFVTSHEIALEWHVRMQAAFQKYVDNAVSKTVNLRTEATKADVASVYLLAHQLRCKGVTVYRDGCRQKQVLSGGITQEASPIPQKQVLSGNITQEASPIPKPRALPHNRLPAKGFSRQTPTGKITLFVREVENKPFDVFVILGRAGSDITAFTEAIGRLLSIALRCNIPVGILAENLIGLGGRTSIGFGAERVLSVPDAIGKILQEEYCEKPEANRAGEICPDCKNTSLQYTEGCLKCPLCGYSEC